MDEDDIEVHSYSEVSTSHCAAKPVAVVTPKNTEEVSTIARICSEYKIPMSEIPATAVGRRKCSDHY
jgi:D-lactate dehydrogenase (cytochrome)